jgi:hypothetical protein
LPGTLQFERVSLRGLNARSAYFPSGPEIFEQEKSEETEFRFKRLLCSLCFRLFEIFPRVQ